MTASMTDRVRPIDPRGRGLWKPPLSRWRVPSILPGFGLSLGITLAYLAAIVIIPLAALAIRPWEIGLSGVWPRSPTSGWPGP